MQALGEGPWSSPGWADLLHLCSFLQSISSLLLYPQQILPQKKRGPAGQIRRYRSEKQCIGFPTLLASPHRPNSTPMTNPRAVLRHGHSLLFPTLCSVTSQQCLEISHWGSICTVKSADSTNQGVCVCVCVCVCVAAYQPTTPHTTSCLSKRQNDEPQALPLFPVTAFRIRHLSSPVIPSRAIIICPAELSL